MSRPLPSDVSQFYAQKKVLVTGGAGFIGSHLTELLLQLGAEVTVVDNFLTGARQNIAHLTAEVIEADASQPVETYLPAQYTPDLVFHFASPASPPKYQAHPVETYLVNSMATHQLLQYLKSKAPAARFLFASTSEVYGDPQVHPQPESYWGNVNPNGVRSCYDEAKRLGETICGVHSRDFQMDVRIVRIFNTYGPRMDLEDGRVIPDFIKQALAGQPFQVYGDGTQTRSYCYVDDLVDGIILLMQKDSAKGQTVNLGNPGEFTVLQTAEVVNRVSAEVKGVEPPSPPPIEFRPLPQDDPLRRRPDIQKAKEVLGWEPVISFEEGLKKTITFFQSRQG